MNRTSTLARAAALILAGVALPAAIALAEPTPASRPADPNRLFPDSRLIVGDRISVEVVGHGPDLVLIPGLSSSRQTWRATAERLRRRYRLHLVQVAGFAGEPARANAIGPVLIPTAEAIDAYLVAAKLTPAAIIGHSLGGTMTLWIAAHRPGHVAKALIVDAVPWFARVMLGPEITPDRSRPVAEAMRAGAPMTDAMADRMLAAMITAPADRARAKGWMLASDHAASANALADDLELDLRGDLASIRTPITVLYPDYAAVGVPAGATDASYAAAYAALPRKTLKRVDHSLHFIMLDQPAAFAADLDAFLARKP